MMYTKLPLAQVFGSSAGCEPILEQIQLKYGILELEQVGDRQVVKRLISTRPADYLNQKYMPGSPAEIGE